MFLSHNSKDKPAVRRLSTKLKKESLTVWLDEEQLQPGLPWMDLLAEGIKSSASVVVLVGKDGLGPWEDEEMQAALQRAVRDKSPVIPVLLPKAGAQPELPMFLGNRTWVDLRGGLTKEGIAKLVWGITGNKPSAQGADTLALSEEFPDNIPLSGAGTVIGRDQPLQDTPLPNEQSNGARGLWQKKLERLLEAEAIAISVDEKFRLEHQIEEARRKIQEMGG